MKRKTEREVLLDSAKALREVPWAMFEIDGAREWFAVGRAVDRGDELWRETGASCAESAAWSTR